MGSPQLLSNKGGSPTHHGCLPLGAPSLMTHFFRPELCGCFFCFSTDRAHAGRSTRTGSDPS